MRPVRRIHVGIDRARLDDIDRDVPRSEIAGQTASQIGDGALRHRINRDTRTCDAFTQATANGDHSAAIFHVLRSCLHRDDRCTHVDVPDAIEVGDRHILEHAWRKDPGVVDQDIKPAQLIPI